MRPLLLALLSVLTTACPGELQDPERFPDGPLPRCQLDIDVPALFESKCGRSDCHGGAEPSGGLDLASPGVYERLADVPSTQCEGRVRVDPADPGSSFLVEKLLGTQPLGCGQRMPLISFLTTAEIACVQRWLYDRSNAEDAGVVDPPDLGEATDSGPEEDGGEPEDLGPTPVDCAAFGDTVADTQLCGMDADTCSILSLNMQTCAAACEAVGLRCTSANDNLAGECAPDPAAATTCDDATRADYHCVCGRP